MRGGATVPPGEGDGGQRRGVKLQVKTDCGLKDLDQKLEVALPATATVGELKRYVQVGRGGGSCWII